VPRCGLFSSIRFIWITISLVGTENSKTQARETLIRSNPFKTGFVLLFKFVQVQIRIAFIRKTSSFGAA
jgi:hypothetical protein